MINFFFKKKSIHQVFLFSAIILFCFFISLANTTISNNIDEAIIINGMVNIPDSISPQLEFMSSSKSLLIYLIAILIKIGFSYYLVSNILLLISTLFFFVGIFLILKNLIKYFLKKYTNLISFLSTCLFILSDTHLPHTDYPNAYFGTFTSGIYSIAISTLIFGLIIDGRKKKTFFFSIILFLVHPVQGTWIISILIILDLIDKFFIKKNYDKTYLRNLLFIIIAGLLIVLFIIIKNYPSKDINIDKNLLDIWLTNWDGHRNNLNIKYNYLKPSGLLLFLSIVCFYLFKKNENEKIYQFYLFTILTIILSTFIYLGYKVTHSFLPFFIIGPMPSRVINTHAMIAYPTIIISSIYIVNYLSNFFKLKNYIILGIFCISLLLYFVLNHNYDNLNNRFNNIYKNRFEKNYFNFLKNLTIKQTDLYDEKFWSKVNKLDDNFYTIITHSTENLTFRYAEKPYIIKITSFDYVPYYPSSVNKTFDILENIYGVEIYSEKKSLSEQNIKLEFEKKTNLEWKAIRKKFNAKYVVVPITWNLNLKGILFNDKFIVYEI